MHIASGAHHPAGMSNGDYLTPIQHIRLFCFDGSGPGGRRSVQRERSDLVFRSACKSLKSRQLLFFPLPFCPKRPIPR